MTQAAMLTVLTDMTGESSYDILLAYLELAAQRVLQRCYPFDPSQTVVPERYQNAQIEIAAYMLNKRGAEGEARHSENGIERSYEAASVPNSMLRGITPVGKVLGGGTSNETP